jgi:predicted metal-binding protein
MNRYRCYFLRRHHIVAVEAIASEEGTSATAMAEAMLRDKPDCESFA